MDGLDVKQRNMSFRKKILLAIGAILLSPPARVWIADRTISAESFVFSLPALVFVVPLLIFALMLRENNHCKLAIVVFVAGMSVYLGFSIYTLYGEFMAPLIGHVYIPTLIFITPICVYSICHQKTKL